MNKVIRLGTVKTFTGSGSEIDADVFCAIRLTNGDLSITGVEGPMRNGDALGSCGQIEMSYRTAEERASITPAPGWDADLIGRFFDTWGRWHLNKMRPGSPRQEEYLREHPVAVTYPERHYEKASAVLAAAGLNPDTEYTPTIPNVNTKEGYRYGHAWIREDVPEDVIAFLSGLPDADKVPAWI